jgi:hypothetical protein
MEVEDTHFVLVTICINLDRAFNKKETQHMETVYKRAAARQSQTVLDSKGQTQSRRYHQTALESAKSCTLYNNQHMFRNPHAAHRLQKSSALQMILES